MATIKSYTDLSQSKTLSKILSLESADMYYPWYIEDDGDTIESGHRITTPRIGNFTTHKVNKMILPCWSLVALLVTLNFPSLTQNKEDKWEVCIIDHKNDEYIEMTANNPIDACVAIIEKLHELNLL